MNFFKRDYNKPGPGVPKNAPKKKGFARFFEILVRDFGDLVKLSIWVEICCLPAQLMAGTCMVLMVLKMYPLAYVAAALALCACVLVLPALVAQSHILVRRLRDTPGFFWQDFKTHYKDNFVSLIPFSLLYGLLYGSQVFAVFFVLGQLGMTIHPVVLGAYLLSAMLLSMAMPYFFVQKAYLSLKGFALIKNSLLLSLGYLPRSFMGALLFLLLSGQLFVYICFLLPAFLPLVFIYILVFGHSVAALVNLMWIWPPVDKTFNIDKTLKERDEEKYSHVETNVEEPLK